MRSRLNRAGFLNFRNRNQNEAASSQVCGGKATNTLSLNSNHGGGRLIGRIQGSSSRSKEGQILMSLSQKMRFLVGSIMCVIIAAAIITNMPNSSNEVERVLETNMIGVDLDLIADNSATTKGDDHLISLQQQQKTEEKSLTSSKPIFMLHVGPPKTGSTTLQCTLESLRNELEKDGITYIGRPECHAQGLDIAFEYKKEFRLFEKALVTGYSCHQELIQKEKNDTNAINNQELSSSSSFLLSSYPQCWRDFTDRLEKYRDEGTNVIFSDEAMSNRIARTWDYKSHIPYPWISLKSVLEGLGWDVRVVIVHRPLYDYLPSVYIEQFKDGPYKIRLRRWFGGSNDNNSNRSNGDIHMQCPSYGGRVIPRPFDHQTSEITIARLLDPNQKLYPTPAQVYELFRDHHFNVILVDMMERKQNKDFIHHIICDHFPGTVHTCQGLLKRTNDHDIGKTEFEKETSGTVVAARQLNPSLSLHYDFIAVEACQRGLINGTNIQRDVARKAIQFRQESDLGLSPDDFPLDCPDDTILKELLRLSLDHERRLRNISDGSSSNSTFTLNESKLFEEKFWETVRNKKKLCTVNSKLVVEDLEWVSFFPTIRNIEE